MTDLTHFGPGGRPRMVDVGAKDVTERVAVATGLISMSPETLETALARDTKKGDPIAIAEIAGVMGAKRTADLVPLCHPLPLSGCEVEVVEAGDGRGLLVTARVKTTGRTGVEMEALTAVSVACLTLYDMLKAIDKDMVVGDIKLIEKSGGRSGDYRRASE